MSPAPTALVTFAAIPALSDTPAPPRRTDHSCSTLLYSLLLVSYAHRPEHCCIACCHHKPISSDTPPHAQLSSPPLHTLTPAALGTLSDVLRNGKVCAYLCLSLMLSEEGQINHKLKLSGM